MSIHEELTLQKKILQKKILPAQGREEVPRGEGSTVHIHNYSEKGGSILCV